MRADPLWKRASHYFSFLSLLRNAASPGLPTMRAVVFPRLLTNTKVGMERMLYLRCREKELPKSQFTDLNLTLLP